MARLTHARSAKPTKTGAISTLRQFLVEHQDEILAMVETKSLALAGGRPRSDELKQGLPIFFQQFLGVLLLRRPAVTIPSPNSAAAAKGAGESDEPAIARAKGEPEEEAVASSAALHGTEMLRLGYTLSHVIHAYGAMCQSITELAAKKHFVIDTAGFHDLNQCLDVAIAGAVTEYQSLRDTQVRHQETESLGELTHEMRNAVSSATIALQIVKKGTVGLAGNTGQVLERSLKRMAELIDRSLTEVRLRVDTAVHVESTRLVLIVDQILITARLEAEAKKQRIDVDVDSSLIIDADQQAFHSALSNLIQNALKFTHDGARIQVRGKLVGEHVEIEVEDECGGLAGHDATDMFKPFTKQHENRKGLGLGLTIAQRAIALNHGTLNVRDVPGKGCIFKITLPKKPTESADESASERPKVRPSAPKRQS